MSQFLKEVQAAEEELLVGNVILYPTDTVWGIGCDAENTAAVRKIFKIKEREESKAMILLVADQQMLLHYVRKLPADFEQLAKQQERPTTYVFSEPQNLPKELLAEDGTVAIRIAQDEFCHRLIRQIGRPIVSTSANVSGEPSPKTFADVSNIIKERVDFVVRWRQGDPMDSKPSRIVKINPDGSQQVLRD
ncbi:L-threonylcarbamoyladenylate synthase [Pontibacter ummariensis]|uniref:L-threonylcarbamoyladenylate synthase n=1 Tax=Pontibacter ummariensis TaxID=1610492 RepID=A0A239EZX7_9BACT|nr:L-threonylcarbamoyladenylate synthase [Pontibacter ummariensis]PRY12692.1 L-threonylcarbamoyladenylate synthase [Pontibacter ummariensis]SNS49462.1 L-threonylcarbamoyladenylate synthase [Pontibacter ummariensis]